MKPVKIFRVGAAGQQLPDVGLEPGQVWGHHALTTLTTGHHNLAIGWSWNRVRAARDFIVAGKRIVRGDPLLVTDTADEGVVDVELAGAPGTRTSIPVDWIEVLDAPEYDV